MSVSCASLICLAMSVAISAAVTLIDHKKNLEVFDKKGEFVRIFCQIIYNIF